MAYCFLQAVPGAIPYVPEHLLDLIGPLQLRVVHACSIDNPKVGVCLKSHCLNSHVPPRRLDYAAQHQGKVCWERVYHDVHQAPVDAKSTNSMLY